MSSVFRRALPYGLAVALVASAAHLGWEYTHGGVASHHLLARPDLPAVSNWWGLLIPPLLGWLASWMAVRRAAVDGRAANRSVSAFLGALLVGLALSFSFAAGYASLASGIFFTALAAGLLLPTYRAEYVFGFVLGMTFVLGSVLPAAAAAVGAAISAAAHFLIRPIMAGLLRAVRA
ncbi:hypothetical protein CO641_03090 [Lysobacteraceae bacterium NML91-0213]|nr:hypothetical protein CO641_03090 [Xanthomonadaceae bacterium NML91-0213]